MKHPVIQHRSERYLSDVQKAAASAGIVLFSGRAISGDAFINSAETSRKLAEEFSAAVVDMESAAVAKLCWSTGRDVLAVRYVSDNANHDSAVDWKTNVTRSAGVFNSILKKLCFPVAREWLLKCGSGNASLSQYHVLILGTAVKFF